MTGQTIYKSGDRFRLTMAIGKLEVKLIGSSTYQLPMLFPPGSLGQIISSSNGELDVYLEDAAANIVHKVRLPLIARGKLEPYDHFKSWC